MNNQLQKNWNKAWDIACEITDLIRYAADDRSKPDDAKRLVNLLAQFDKEVIEAISTFSEDDFCSSVEKDSLVCPRHPSDRS